MAATKANSFEFLGDTRGEGVTVLNAVMSDFAYGRHAHEELAIGVTLAGVQEFYCQGRTYRSVPGDVILFNPGDVHDGHPGKGAALRYTMLYLDPTRVLPLIRGDGGGDGDTNAGPCRLPETHFRDRTLRSLVLDLARRTGSGNESALERELRLVELARRLGERMGIRQHCARAGAPDALLARALEYVHDNLGAQITVDDLGRVAHLSKYHFIRMFRAQMGMTPHKYILNLRINRVREALGHGIPPSRAAQDFGFFDASHMARHFKRAFGVSPGRYQAQLAR